MVNPIRFADLEATEEFLESIVAICNEKTIYDWLFVQRLQGAPYPKEDAIFFKEWGTRGWKESTHFLFIATDRNGHAAACDMKSSDLNGAEIGYWASHRHRGIMTNAVRGMVAAGFDAKFRRFYAQVKKGNAGSVGVLTRVGFTETDEFADEIYDSFELHRGS